jgi:hypothetical protein
MAARGHGGNDIDKVHDMAAEKFSQGVGLCGKNDFGHFRSGSVDVFRLERRFPFAMLPSLTCAHSVALREANILGITAPTPYTTGTNHERTKENPAADA